MIFHDDQQHYEWTYFFRDLANLFHRQLKNG